MPGNDLLSVCCLGYRHAPFIRDCITSIWQGGWRNTEIVAMDDGSNDGSAEILKEMQAQSRCPFTIIEQENTGNIPANFNRLFRESKGDFVVFTSLDDIQLPNMLASRMEKLVGDEKCAFAAHVRSFALEGEKTLKPDFSPASGIAPDAEALLELEYSLFHSFYIQGCVFRRDIVQAVGGFSENMLGDDIVLRTKIFFWLMAHPEMRLALIDEPGFVYRRHPGNVSQNVLRQVNLAFQYCDRFWKKRPLPEMAKCWLITGLETVPYEKILDVFATFEKAAALLRDRGVAEALRLCAVRSFLKEQKAQGDPEEKR